MKIYSMWKYTVKIWKYAVCENIQHAKIYIMWIYAVCENIQCVKIYSMWKYKVCENTTKNMIIYSMWKYTVKIWNI